MKTTLFTRRIARWIPVFALALAVTGCGGSDAEPAETSDRIEGTWEAVVTQRDCATNAALATFSGAQVMHRGGTLSDTSGAPPTTRGPGYGVWSGSGGNYTSKFRYFRYNADGTLAGTNVVTRTIVLAADGNSHTATTRQEIRSVTGAVLATDCASDISMRFS